MAASKDAANHIIPRHFAAYIDSETQDFVVEKNFLKNQKKLKKSVDKRVVVCYSNKADAAEGTGGTPKESGVP